MKSNTKKYMIVSKSSFIPQFPRLELAIQNTLLGIKIFSDPSYCPGIKALVVFNFEGSSLGFI